jgi:hypothetical protein
MGGYIRKMYEYQIDRINMGLSIPGGGVGEFYGM